MRISCFLELSSFMKERRVRFLCYFGTCYLFSNNIDGVSFLIDGGKASRWLEDCNSRGIHNETVSMRLRSMIYSIAHL